MAQDTDTKRPLPTRGDLVEDTDPGKELPTPGGSAKAYRTVSSQPDHTPVQGNTGEWRATYSSGPTPAPLVSSAPPKGGNTLLAKDSMKYEALNGRKDNLAAKRQFCEGNYARSGDK